MPATDQLLTFSNKGIRGRIQRGQFVFQEWSQKRENLLETFLKLSFLLEKIIAENFPNLEWKWISRSRKYREFQRRKPKEINTKTHHN